MIKLFKQKCQKKWDFIGVSVEYICCISEFLTKLKNKTKHYSATLFPCSSKDSVVKTASSPFTFKVHLWMVKTAVLTYHSDGDKNKNHKWGYVKDLSKLRNRNTHEKPRLNYRSKEPVTNTSGIFDNCIYLNSALPQICLTFLDDKVGL